MIHASFLMIHAIPCVKLILSIPEKEFYLQEHGFDKIPDRERSL